MTLRLVFVLVAVAACGGCSRKIAGEDRILQPGDRTAVEIICPGYRVAATRVVTSQSVVLLDTQNRVVHPGKDCTLLVEREGLK